MMKLIEGVFSKILGLATLKYFKFGTYYIIFLRVSHTNYRFLRKSGLLKMSIAFRWTYSLLRRPPQGASKIIN